jgi:hypothetical protein
MDPEEGAGGGAGNVFGGIESAAFDIVVDLPRPSDATSTVIYTPRILRMKSAAGSGPVNDFSTALFWRSRMDDALHPAAVATGGYFEIVYHLRAKPQRRTDGPALDEQMDDE